MKTHTFLFALILLSSTFLSFGQSSFMTDSDVAVFYPAAFDSTRTLPSLAIPADLLIKTTIPSDWKLNPVFSIENGKSVVRITYSGTADLYGTGEVTGALRRNDTKITLWNTDNLIYSKDGGKRLYQSHPWVMGVRADGSAFGIIADNSWKQTLSLSNPITFTSDGPAFRVIVIEKKNPQDLLKALGVLTGTMSLPPLWAIGYQQSRYSYYPDSRVKQIADLFRTKQIPCDVIWMDIHYMDAFKIFTFDPVKFPDPTSLNNYLHGKNIKSVYMINPGVKKETGYTIYDQGTAGGHWVKDKNGNEYNGRVWPGPCAFPDFTRPETRSWWSGLYSSFMSTGVDGVWNDMNEPSVFDGPDGTMPEDNIHQGGGGLAPDVHARYHNVYGMLMIKASREGILNANPSKRPFVLSRANFLGGQRYGATWTGDNASTMNFLKMSIPMSINLGLSGQPFNGPDLGGYSTNCTADLFSHWIAIGVYFPFCRNHTESGTVDQEPWAFGAKTEAVSRTAINRRYRLLPYFYTLFKEAATTGMPIMCPQYFADLTDLNLRTEEQSFLLGSDLMIVPRWADNVKVPNANWNKVNFETTDDGYQPLVLIRPGAIVPLGKVIQSTVDYNTDSITLLLNPTVDGAASGTLYHDGGDGFGYQTGDYVIHQFTSSKYHADSLRIDISKTEGNKTVNRLYRIGYVTDEGTVYNNWSTATTQYVKIIEDTHPTIDLSLLNKVHVGGTFTNWAANLMTQSITNKRLWTTTLIIPAGAQELKFSFQSDWTSNSWGNATGLTGTAQIIPAGNAGISFTVANAGNYELTFNDSSLVYSIQYKSPLAGLPWDGTIATSYAGGIGALSDPWIISSPAELAYLSKRVNGGANYSNKHFVLTNDLDLNNIPWTPIGYSTNSFKATFNGNKHLISNLNVNLPTSTGVGLFGLALDASIMDLGIVGTSTVTGSSNVGGIVGQFVAYYASGFGISGCFNNAAVSSGSSTGNSVGGIVGNFRTTASNISSSINNCYSTGNISGTSTSGINYVSGIVGKVETGPALTGTLLTISNSYATGTKTATGGTSNFASGIAKLMTGVPLTVTNCYYINGSGVTGATVKTATQMQAPGFVTTINASQSPAAWQTDFAGVSSVNNGFPILAWRTQNVLTSINSIASMPIMNGRVTVIGKTVTFEAPMLIKNMQLYNFNGQLVETKNINYAANQLSFDVEQAGIYLLIAHTAEGQLAQKITIK